MSVLSFPERGPWGNAKWRGNCSGHIYQHLFKLLNPHTFVDPMVGGGTSTDVATEMNIESLGLDLHSGFDILSESIKGRLPKHWNGATDLCISHLPYADMVLYSGEVWGNAAHANDLSRCVSVDDFLEKAAQAILNQREATRENGVYGYILGDLRRKGEYHALATDLQSYLPRKERRAILVKIQHNVLSNSQTYGRLRFGRIEHEYVVLYERSAGDVYFALACAAQTQKMVSGGTWRAVVRYALNGLGERFTVSDVYAAVFKAAPERVQQSQHWQAKTRQVLQQLPELRGHGGGVWERAA